MNPTIIRVVGIDAAFANMGFAHADLYLSVDGRLTDIQCAGLSLVSTKVTEDRKVVRKSSTELRRAQELAIALQQHCRSYRYAFVEVPSGSQSASAARALGIAVGVLAGCPIPIIEVNPMEVKEAVAGRKKGPQPSKAEVIDWAVKRWPDAPWLRHTRSSPGKRSTKGEKKGQIVGRYSVGDLTNENEHLADAMASIVAGVMTPEFQRVLVLGGFSFNAPSPSRSRVRLA